MPHMEIEMFKLRNIMLYAAQSIDLIGRVLPYPFHHPWPWVCFCEKVANFRTFSCICFHSFLFLILPFTTSSLLFQLSICSDLLVLPGYSSFLPLSKNMTVWFIGLSTLPLWVCTSWVSLCCPVMDGGYSDCSRFSFSFCQPQIFY